MYNFCDIIRIGEIYDEDIRNFSGENHMKNKMILTTILFSVLIIIYFVLPLTLVKCGVADPWLIFSVLVNPAAVITVSAVYGIIQGLSFWFSPLCAVFFLPAIWIYDSFSWITAVVYAVLSLMSLSAAAAVRAVRKKKT